MDNSENIAVGNVRRNNVSPYTDIGTDNPEINNRSNISPITSNISPATAYTRPMTSNVSPATANIQPMTGNISPTTANVQPAVSNISPAMTNVSPTMANARPMFANISPATANVRPAMNNNPAMSDNVSPVTENMRPALPNVSPVENKVSPATEQECPKVEFMPSNPRYGFAYVPYQKFTKTYSPEEALRNGTAFPELHHPYPGNKKPYMCGPTGYYGGENRG